MQSVACTQNSLALIFGIGNSEAHLRGLPAGSDKFFNVPHILCKQIQKK
jgi:hypothetical protein